MIDKKKIQEIKKDALISIIESYERKNQELNGDMLLGICLGISEYEKILKLENMEDFE